MRHLRTLLVGILFCTSIAWAKQAPHTDLTAPTSEQTLELIERVTQLVDGYYVDEVDKQKLLEGALKGMLESLDPHTTYLSETTLSLLRDNNRGYYYGYGIEIAIEDEQVRIVTPLDGSSAAAAGVQPGDVLLQVDDLEASANNIDPVIAYIKQGSIDDRPLRLTMKRSNQQEPIEFLLAPTAIDVKSSSYKMLNDDVGYIKISSFNSETADDVRAAGKALMSNNINGLVLDLRNNPGGLLDAAVEISDMFLSKGTIVSTHGRNRDDNEVYQANAEAIFEQVPVTVLINEGSASAAEIVAGALQDQGRATLVGERSYGKGSVQSVIPLYGLGGALKLTTALYATPNGTFIDQQGIEPDRNVSFASIEEGDIVDTLSASNRWTDDSQLFAAHKILTND